MYFIVLTAHLLEEVALVQLDLFIRVRISLFVLLVHCSATLLSMMILGCTAHLTEVALVTEEEVQFLVEVFLVFH